MKTVFPNLFAAVIVVAMSGCIKNDIPYPRIQANILTIAAQGQERQAQIDSAQRIVTLYLPEDANIYQTMIDGYTLTPKAEIVSGDLSQPIDLSSPYAVTIRLYQDYVWRIEAKQDIQRSFILENQIGSSVIDVPGHRVVATVSNKVNLESVLVEVCKLGSSSAVMTPEINGRKVDFTHPVTVSLENYGHIEQWTIYVSCAETAVETLSADAWTCVGWVYGEAEAGKHNTVQYRIKGDTEWLTVPDAWITSDGGSFYARITGLVPNTAYEARAVSDSEYGEVLEMTTGSIMQMPDSNFDQWWLDGKVWDPWAEGGTQFWDTGNKGAATLGQSNTVPTDDTVDGQGQAAMLQTKFVGIGIIGKLAAGNIFAGRYVRTDGTNGVLSMGQPFTERPTRLTGYMKYKTAPISSVTAGFEDYKGRPDTCIVWVALIDSNEPFEIRTNPNNRQLFDPDGPEVVAYGKMECGSDVDAYVPFEVTLEYKSTSRKPKYILCTSSASKYGDYFTGGNGAILWIDNYKLEYDY